MNSRHHITRVFVFTMLLFMVAAPSYAQVKDSTLNYGNDAMKHLYQKVKRTPIHFPNGEGFLKHSYLSVSNGLGTVMDWSNFSFRNRINGASRVAYGGWFTPVHGMEVSGYFNVHATPYSADITESSHIFAYGLEANYMFNFTNYTYRKTSSRWNVIGLIGTSYGFSNQSKPIWGAHAAIRGLYSPNTAVSLYLEPRWGIYNDNLDGYTSEDIHIQQMLYLGLQINLGNTYRKSSDYDTEQKTAIAFKTNLAYWLALAPNVGFEIPLSGKRWSIAGEWIFPWWLDKKKNDFAIQLLSGNLEGRFWLGDNTVRRQLTGFFVGLYAGGGLYDFQFSHKKGYQGDFYIATGVSAGYVVALSKRLTLEYSLGIGYLVTNYDQYKLTSGGKILAWQNQGKYTWIGPTKMNITLGWSILNNKRK